MYAHEKLIQDFYTAFGKLDAGTMVECYHKDIVFWDPVFETLEARQVKAMWHMLCGSAQDFTLDLRDIKTTGNYGSCNWFAFYTFSQTGRHVINDVKARFKFQDGKIIEHLDDFDLWRWSRQALGTPGKLFGWTPFMQAAIRKKARNGLKKYMKAEKERLRLKGLQTKDGDDE